jgi:hypothetical protein
MESPNMHIVIAHDQNRRRPYSYGHDIAGFWDIAIDANRDPMVCKNYGAIGQEGSVTGV